MAEGARAKVMAKAARDVLLMARVAPGMVRTGLVMVRIAPDMVRTGHVTARTNPTMGRIVQGTARIVPDTARTAPVMAKRSRITDRIVQGTARTVPDSMKTGLATITIGHTSIIITTSPASALTAGALTGRQRVSQSPHPRNSPARAVLISPPQTRLASTR